MADHDRCIWMIKEEQGFCLKKIVEIIFLSFCKRFIIVKLISAVSKIEAPRSNRYSHYYLQTRTFCYSTRRSPLSTLRVYSRGHPPPFNPQAFPLYLSTLSMPLKHSKYSPITSHLPPKEWHVIPLKSPPQQLSNLESVITASLIYTVGS